MSCFLKKRTLWPLERALNLPQLPPQQQAPEPQGSTLRLWSTAPKTLVLLTLKVPFAALCPSPPSANLLALLINKSCIYVPFDMEQDFGKQTACCAFVICACMQLCVDCKNWICPWMFSYSRRFIHRAVDFFPFVFKWLESYKRNSEVLFLLTLLHKSSLNLQVKKKSLLCCCVMVNLWRNKKRGSWLGSYKYALTEFYFQDFTYWRSVLQYKWSET